MRNQNMVNREEIIKRAISVYGMDAQLLMAIEEMSELTKAICKEKCERGSEKWYQAVDNIAEEIADVQIMLDQLRTMYSIYTGSIEEQKLIRLQDRLNKKVSKQ